MSGFDQAELNLNLFTIFLLVSSFEKQLNKFPNNLNGLEDYWRICLEILSEFRSFFMYVF